MSLYENNIRIDSTKVENGSFRLEGEIPESSYARLDLGRNYANFIAGEGEVVIDFESHLPVSGNRINMDLKRIDEELDSIEKCYATIVDSIGNSSLGVKEKRAEVKKLFIRYKEETGSKIKEFAVANGENGIGEDMCMKFANLAFDDPRLWQDFYAGLSPWLRNRKGVTKINDGFKAAIATDEGCMFADVAGETPDGETAKLSDYLGRGKYVLVDFWASWCGPCLAEAKETLKPLFEKYGDNDNFMILGVATWDKKENTLQAIEKHGLGWKQLWTPGDSAMKAYGISGIPMIILFSPDGHILKRDLRGDALTEAVETSLATNQKNQ